LRPAGAVVSLVGIDQLAAALEGQPERRVRLAGDERPPVAVVLALEGERGVRIQAEDVRLALPDADDLVDAGVGEAHRRPLDGALDDGVDVDHDRAGALHRSLLDVR
jgi:hypothetical protein